MFKLSLLVLLSVVAACQGFSLKQVGQLSAPDSKHSSLGIFGGKNTTIDKVPYLVSLVYDGGTFIGEYISGAAAIVSSRWVIMGATITDFPLELITVVAGSSDGLTGQKYSIKKVVVHPKYSEGSVDYCYGLAQINGTFKWSRKIKPVKLATKQPKARTSMVVAGYGHTTVESSSNRGLMRGTMKWLPLSTCKKYYEGYYTFTSRLGCVFNKGHTTLCGNDWSAPVVRKNLLYGYFIGTNPQLSCSTSAYPDVVANVPTVAAWIKKITGAQTEDDEN